MWWVEPSFVFVQHWPFQLHQQVQSDVEKNKRRCRWRRVKAKSKPMMNWVYWCSVRDPNVLASTASESPEDTKPESQNVPLSSFNVQQTGTGRPVSNKLVIDIDMDYDTAAESDLSLKSRSFLNRVNDRLRKMPNRSPEDSMQDIDKRSMSWECLCLWQWKHLCSWERITQTIYIPSNIQGKISL